MPFPPPPLGLARKVALLKAAAGLSDEELTWRMETAKPEANAYRIAAAALERAETTYERLLWRQVRGGRLGLEANMTQALILSCLLPVAPRGTPQRGG